MSGGGPMDAEFDTVAEWTAEVAESLVSQVIRLVRAGGAPAG